MPLAQGHKGVHLVEFTDMECPACRHFHETSLRSALDSAATSPTLSIVHFPLRGHRFAQQAATAAECAGNQGRGHEFVELVFSWQDSIGIVPWESFARSANVSDAPEFARCVAAGPPERVLAGRSLAAELQINETPTIFINGRRFNRPPSADELRRVILEMSALP